MTVREANEIALERIERSRPVLVGVEQAGKVIPGMKKTRLMHAGPPVEWERMCEPMKGAVIGALMYEGLSKTPDDAVDLAKSGDIEFESNNDHDSVNGMAGIISYSMPVWVVKNYTYGNSAYAQFQEGTGKTLRFGCYSPGVIERLKWFEDEMGPAIGEALRGSDGIDLKVMISDALLRGDECHNQNRAGTSMFIEKMAALLVDSDVPRNIVSRVLKFMTSNTQFFVTLAMSASKATLAAASGVKNSSIVTVMSRNGSDFGIKVSGLPDRWFAAPSPIVRGSYFAGYSEADANPDMGDSCITETGSLGAFALAASPSIAQLVGETVAGAVEYTMEMYRITVGESSTYRIPYLDFRGTPIGIDVRRVVETGIAPIIDTAIAHKASGHGMIGAGLLRAPMACFTAALRAMGQEFDLG